MKKGISSVVLKEALQPDFDIIKKQYKQLSESFEGILYDDDGPLGWTNLARDFIF